jgi:hypothetical protein
VNNSVASEQASQFTLNLDNEDDIRIFYVSGGDILITGASFFVVVAGTLLTSVSVRTSTINGVVLLTAAEGTVANLLASKELAFAYSRFPFLLKSGYEMYYTIVNGPGTGQIRMTLRWMRTTNSPNAHFV